jgi:hypothetical protein
MINASGLPRGAMTSMDINGGSSQTRKMTSTMGTDDQHSEHSHYLGSKHLATMYNNFLLTTDNVSDDGS